METYSEMKERHQQEVNALPIKFAFSNNQFKDICKSWGFTVDDAPNMIYSGGMGMYYLRKDSDLIRDTFERVGREESDALRSSFDFAVQAFEYEMYNHEYSYTMEADDMLDSLGLDWSDLNDDPMLLSAFRKAKEKVLRGGE